MGCAQSRVAAYGQPQATATALSAPSSAGGSSSGTRPMFEGAMIGCQLWHLDASSSKWVRAVVADVNGRDEILIHHISSSSSSAASPPPARIATDVWINIRHLVQDGDMTALTLSPIDLLSRHQCDCGTRLDTKQADISWYFLRKGKLPSVMANLIATESDDVHIKGGLEQPFLEGASEKLGLYGSHSNSIIRSQEFLKTLRKGMKVDVQEQALAGNAKDFSGKESARRWRKARIVHRDPESDLVRVHYIGLGDQDDEVINIQEDSTRIQEYGSMSRMQFQAQGGRRAGGSLLKAKSVGVDSSLEATFSPAALSPSPARLSFADAKRRRSADASSIDSAIKGLRIVPVSEGSFYDAQSPSSPVHEDEQAALMGASSISLWSRGSGGSDNSHVPKQPSSMRKNSFTPKGLVRRSSFPGPNSSMLWDTRFLDRMEGIGLHVVEVEGDGNCLFRAVSHQLYLSEEHHMQLRTMCVEHMSRHRGRFQPFCPTNFDDHLRLMRQCGTWADDLEIRALEELLDREFSLYSSESRDAAPTPMNINFDEHLLLESAEPIKLSYHGMSHYNSIFDEKTPLPLDQRTSTVLLDERVRAFEGGWQELKTDTKQEL